MEMSKSVTVLRPGKNSNGKRNNKYHCCVYCETLSTNIARNMSLKHKSEIEVAQILMLPKKCKERRKMWDVLVKKGDFAHNYNILEKGDGVSITKGSPKHQRLFAMSILQGVLSKIGFVETSKVL